MTITTNDSQYDETSNPDIVIGDYRWIAVRGLIPGNEGAEVIVKGKRETLKRFYHRTDGWSELAFETGLTAALPHTTEIGLKA